MEHRFLNPALHQILNKQSDWNFGEKNNQLLFDTVIQIQVILFEETHIPPLQKLESYQLTFPDIFWARVITWLCLQIGVIPCFLWESPVLGLQPPSLRKTELQEQVLWWPQWPLIALSQCLLPWKKQTKTLKLMLPRFAGFAAKCTSKKQLHSQLKLCLWRAYNSMRNYLWKCEMKKARYKIYIEYNYKYVKSMPKKSPISVWWWGYGHFFSLKMLTYWLSVRLHARHI